MSIDIKLSKAQIAKTIQSGGSFGSWLANLSKKAVTNVSFPLARDNLLGLVWNLSSNAINKFEIKISAKGAVRVGRGFTLFISIGDMNDIIKTIRSLEVSNVLTVGTNEIIENELKKTRKWSFISIFNFFSSKRYQ